MKKVKPQGKGWLILRAKSSYATGEYIWKAHHIPEAMKLMLAAKDLERVLRCL